MDQAHHSSRSDTPGAGVSGKRIPVGFASPTRFRVPIPHNEPDRLTALRGLGVLDTPEEQVFDQITDLAAFVCDAPMAVISLVDSERQWFKSKVGVNAKETPRDVAFCAHAIMQTDLFVVPDATKDERFADNPLVVSEPGVRFYAGAPLVTKDRHVVGTLCVLDRVPRALSTAQAETLRRLSRQVVTLLEMRRQVVDLKRDLAGPRAGGVDG